MKDQSKSLHSNSNGSLYVCSIDIGQKKDITLRVIDCLKNTQYIACEDTRKGLIVLKKLGIFNNQILFCMDQHQEKKLNLTLFKKYISKNNVAYITDAGTPGISDPGSILINYCYTNNIPVQILPGASALSAFISASGELISDFYFGGFMPRKSSEILTCTLKCIVDKTHGIWFESPKRILSTIKEIASKHPNIKIVIAKELTKPHECILKDTAISILKKMNDIDLRGEWALIINGKSIKHNLDHQTQKIAESLHGIGLSGKQIKQIAPLFNLPKNKLYETFQNI